MENNIFFPALVAHLRGIFLPSMLWRCINGHFLWIEINKTLIDRNFAQVSKKRKKCIEISPNAFQEWSKVIYTKCYKISNESCTFAVFGQITPAIMKISVILLKCLTFQAGFATFYWAKKNKKIWVSVNYRSCIKKNYFKISFFGSK